MSQISKEQFDKLPNYVQDEINHLRSELEKTSEELAISRDRKYSRISVSGHTTAKPEAYIPEDKTINIKTKSGNIYITLSRDKTGIYIAEYTASGKQLIVFPSGGVNTLRISLIPINRTDIQR